MNNSITVKHVQAAGFCVALVFVLVLAAGWSMVMLEFTHWTAQNILPAQTFPQMRR